MLNTPTGHLPLLCLRQWLELARFWVAKESKRQVNAFFIYAVPRYSHLRRGFRMDTHDKYTENNPTIWDFLSWKFSYPIKVLYYSILQTTKEYKIIHRRTVNQSQANEKSFAWDWFFIRLRVILHTPGTRIPSGKPCFLFYKLKIFSFAQPYYAPGTYAPVILTPPLSGLGWPA